MNYSLAIHGGAGTILKSEMKPEIEQAYLAGLRNSLTAGEQILREGGSALDAVCACVTILEDDPLFNAGRGSVFTHDGKHEMDAAIMSGKDQLAGAVAGITGVKNPILLARLIMEKSDFVMLSGIGAESFAKNAGLEFREKDYFFNDYRYKQWLAAKESGQTSLDHASDKKFGTVGAVAFDIHGNIAAATSTGGMTNKRYGRIGDTPVIGAGTYASNDSCAVSCTGHGEFFIRGVAAYDVACLVKYKGMSLADAADQVINQTLKPIGGEGGLIAVDTKGNITMTFNSDGMYRACVKAGNPPEILIYR